MLEESIVRLCAPTLAGMKTGSLISCAFSGPEDMRRAMSRVNRSLAKKGLRILPLQNRNGRTLLYLYRPSQLCRDLQDSAVCRLLRERGYCMGSPERCILQLRERLREEGEFPHEIGLFLGYPPEDVCGFIDNRCCKCVGCWKVYGDPEAAQARFEKFRRCTRICWKLWQQGVPIDRLAAAV